jgi:hypothetical protein
MYPPTANKQGYPGSKLKFPDTSFETRCVECGEKVEVKNKQVARSRFTCSGCVRKSPSVKTMGRGRR